MGRTTFDQVHKHSQTCRAHHHAEALTLEFQKPDSPSGWQELRPHGDIQDTHAGRLEDGFENKGPLSTGRDSRVGREW